MFRIPKSLADSWATLMSIRDLGSEGEAFTRLWANVGLIRLAAVVIRRRERCRPAATGLLPILTS